MCIFSDIYYRYSESSYLIKVNTFFKKWLSLTTFLDLIFITNKSSTVKILLKYVVPTDNCHPYFILSFEFNCFSSTPMFSTLISLKLRIYVTQFNWEHIFHLHDKDKAMSTVFRYNPYVHYFFCILVHINHSTSLPWFTKELKIVIYNKNKAHAKYK